MIDKLHALCYNETVTRNSVLPKKAGQIMFLPNFIFPKITDISLDFLQEHGIDCLLMDFDNTMLPYTTDTPSEELLTWAKDMQSSGIYLCIVSNSKRPRVPTFSRNYGIPCVTHSRKPGTAGIRRAMGKRNIQNVALVGDQIFTDVLGANRARIISILVKPINNHNIWLKLRHVLEQPFIALSKKRRITI